MFRKNPVKNFRSKKLFDIKITGSEEAEESIREQGSSVSPWYVSEVGNTYPVFEVNSNAYYVKVKGYSGVISVMKKDAVIL